MSTDEEPGNTVTSNEIDAVEKAVGEAVGVGNGTATDDPDAERSPNAGLTNDLVEDALVEDALVEDALVEDALVEDEAAPIRPIITDPAELRAALEAVLFVVEAPVDVAALATAFELPVDVVAAALTELSAELDARGSGVELRSVAGGVRLYSRPAHAGWVEAFLLDGQRSKLTQAALETLAVIAYRQPVTRARISAIRGVNVDGVVRTLLSRGMITEVGADPETGGGLYRTTDLFLEKMGLQSLEELPSLAPLLPEIDGLDIDEL